MDRRLRLSAGVLLVAMCVAGVRVQAQQIWTNAMVHPWATSIKCNSGSTTLVSTVSSQPAGCIYASGSADGAQILFATCNNQNVQWFNINKDGSGLFTFKNSNNGRCMDGWGQATNQPVRQYGCTTGTIANQKYALEYTRAVTGCPNDWSSYRIKIGTQCVTISGSQLIWQPCASDKFTPSQNFFIQNGGGGTPTGGCTGYYTVKSGDTCWWIWTNYNLGETNFKDLNPGVDCNNLQIGQKVCIAGTPSPGTPPSPQGQLAYPQVVAYWGARWGDGPLRTACDQKYTVINIAFLVSFGYYQDVSKPTISANGGSYYAIGQDVPYCQGKGIKVLLSLGGGGGQFGFSNSADAQWTADQIWNLYLGGSAGNRPFGSAILNGIDFDLESGNGAYFVDFIDRLNGYYTRSGREYWFTAAPQCPFPDAAMKSFLSARGYLFKYFFIQFYNNPYCATSNIKYYYETTWSPFAKGFNPQPKLIIGLPAAPGAAGSGYIDPWTAASTIRSVKYTGTLGGFGFWCVDWDYSNRFSGATWSQTVLNAGVN